jgi:hypothetical protein
MIMTHRSRLCHFVIDVSAFAIRVLDALEENTSSAIRQHDGTNLI